MRRIIAISAGALCLLSLAACSSASTYPPSGTVTNAPQENSATPTTFYLKLSNGTQVLCAGTRGVDSSAPTTISCDWTNAQGLNKPAAG